MSVEDLAQRFAVTPQTIRRDLNELCDARALTRVHCSAMIASGVENLAYEARKFVAEPHKPLIGAAASALIPDHSSLFINIGTMTKATARALAGHARPLVITNNLRVATELYRNPAIEVVLTGRVIRHSNGGIIGPGIVEQIRQFRVDTAVIGTSAIDADGARLDFDMRRRLVRVSVRGKGAGKRPKGGTRQSHATGGQPGHV